MRQGWLEGTTNMWPAGLLLCNLTLHSINLPLFPTYTFKKEEGSLVKNALEELWKQPAREGESCSCGCSSPTEPQASQISQGERVCESKTEGKCVSVCQDQRLQRTSHTLPEKEENALSRERRLSSRAFLLWKRLWQKWVFLRWMTWEDDDSQLKWMFLKTDRYRFPVLTSVLRGFPTPPQGKRLAIIIKIVWSVFASPWISPAAAACGAPTPAAPFGVAWGTLTQGSQVPICSRPTSRPLSPSTRSLTSWPTQTSPAPAWCRPHRTQPTPVMTDCTKTARGVTRELTGSSTTARHGWGRQRPARPSSHL